MRFMNPLREAPYVKVDSRNRFYFMLQQMQSNRWRITGIVLFLFFFIIFGINMAVMFKIEIAENWKEMLLILFGAFVGNLNKVVDYWFNSEDRDKMLIQKVDEEDGASLSSVVEYPTAQKKIDNEPIVIYKDKTSPQEEAKVEEIPTHEEVIVEEPSYEEPTYEEPIVEETYTDEETPTKDDSEEDK